MSEILAASKRSVTRNWPILFRGFLYFIVAFLPQFTEKIVDALTNDKWPTPQKWTLGLILGFTAAAVSLRAYYDGSAQRHSDKMDAQDTQQFTRTDFGVDNPAPAPQPPKP